MIYTTLQLDEGDGKIQILHSISERIRGREVVREQGRFSADTADTSTKEHFWAGASSNCATHVSREERQTYLVGS